jgi:hypothetical protein
MIAGELPRSIGFGDPNTLAYDTGSTIGNYGPMLIPEADAVDAADAGLGMLNRAAAEVPAIAAAPERLALAAAQERLAIEAGDHVPYMNGPIRSFVAADNLTYYRVFTGDRPAGSFLTGAPPASADQAVSGLALPPTNTAEFIQEVTVPAGTRLQSSIVREAFDQPGGLLQFELMVRLPAKNFGEGVPFR